MISRDTRTARASLHARRPRRANRARARRAAGRRRLLVDVVVDPVDPGAVLRLALGRQEDPAAARDQGDRHAADRRGRRRSAGRRRDSRRRLTPRRRLRGGERRHDRPRQSRHRPDGVADHRALRGSRRRGRRPRAGRGRQRQGRRVRVRPRRQAAVAIEGDERGAEPAGGRRGRRHRLVRRRPHLRAVGRGRQDQVGVPARQPAADRAQHRRRRRRARRRCSPAPPAASCSRSTSRPATSPGKATSRPRRAPPSSSASPTSPACRWSTSGRRCAVAYQGRIACFDILRGTLIWSRDFSSLGRHRRRRPPPVRHRRPRRGARARQGDRQLGVEAGQARRTRAERPAARRRLRRPSSTSRATLHLSTATTAACVGRIATDGSAGDRAARGLRRATPSGRAPAARSTRSAR